MFKPVRTWKACLFIKTLGKGFFKGENETERTSFFSGGEKVGPFLGHRVGHFQATRLGPFLATNLNLGQAMGLGQASRAHAHNKFNVHEFQRTYSAATRMKAGAQLLNEEKSNAGLNSIQISAQVNSSSELPFCFCPRSWSMENTWWDEQGAKKNSGWGIARWRLSLSETRWQTTCSKQPKSFIFFWNGWKYW